MKQDVYLALGGNIGNTENLFDVVLALLKCDPCIDLNAVSQYYKTSPVGPIQQEDYLNAVCRIQTSLSLLDLHQKLLAIEKKLGKTPKRKDEPRVIDLDILFYGSKKCVQEGIEIPHPRWQERLFVLQPLSDIVSQIEIEGKVFQIRDMKSKTENFPGQHVEVVRRNV